MDREGMMVAIPEEEYEHLKECKALLMKIQERRIVELNNEIAQMQMNAIDIIPTPNTDQYEQRDAF